MSVPRRVAAAIIVREGRVLVATRPAPGRWQGYWEFPGGGLEPGEDLAAAAERECREELGLAVRAGEVLHTVSWSYGDVTVEVAFLLCEVARDAEPAALEQQQLRWAGAEELTALRFLPANTEVVRHLVAHLR